MQDALTVRQATIHDLPVLVPLFDGYRRFYQRPSDPAGAHTFLLERFRHAQSVVFLAFKAEQALGFTQLYPSFSSAGMARTYILNDLFVQEDARGSGVGTALMRAAADFATATGALRLTLSTDIANTRAQGVYESFGWKRDQQFHVYHLML